MPNLSGHRTLRIFGLAICLAPPLVRRPHSFVMGPSQQRSQWSVFFFDALHIPRHSAKTAFLSWGYEVCFSLAQSWSGGVAPLTVKQPFCAGQSIRTFHALYSLDRPTCQVYAKRRPYCSQIRWNYHFFEVVAVACVQRETTRMYIFTIRTWF